MSWYQSWHNHRFHPHIHWSTFLATSLLATLFLLNQINQAYQGYPDVLRVEADTTTGLVGHWKFDEGSGTTATDSAGSNTGTLTNGPSWITGKIGGALSFDGVDDKIDTGSVFSSAPSSLTLSAWVKWNAPNTSKGIVGKYNTQGFMLYSASANRAACFINGASAITSASSPIAVGEWYFLSCVWDGSNVSIYVNGQLKASVVASSLTNSSNNFSIGNIQYNGFFNGIIDEVHVYNRALSAADVAELYVYTGSSYATPYATPPSYVYPAPAYVTPDISGDTINALSCNRTDVLNAINLAQSGDTVMVPAGNCTWASGLTIPNSKKLTIQGSGSATTVITASPSSVLIFLDRSGSRVTGIGFEEGGIAVDGSSWRIDHNKFKSNTFSVGVSANGANSPQDFPVGVVDHNEFVNMRVLAVAGDLMAHPEWYSPYVPGSGDAVYVEDNTFTFTVFGNVMDCNYGGRYVFRHNIVNDSSVEAHSVQSNNRACRSWEIYDNTLNQISRSVFTPFFIRGGSGVVFNNTITGTWNLPKITFDNVRSFGPKGDGGQCDGDSLWDGNTDSTGYPCRDQIGRSNDSWLWTNSNPYPTQKLDPVYVWNNKYGSTDVTVLIHNCPSGLGSCQHIKENRDYYVGIAKPGYTPYVYPHPLVSGAPAPAYTTPYTYPTPNTLYATPVNNVVENPTQTTNTQTTNITGVDPEETKKALIIQIMIQLIALLTELIIKIKSGAATAISAFSTWGFK